MQKLNTRKITQLAVSLGLIVAMNFIESSFFKMPQGGELSLSTFLFVMCTTMLTFKESTLLFFLWRTILLVLTPVYIVTPLQFILEYYVAFSGFLFIYPLTVNISRPKWVVGLILANLLRYAVHSISGVVYFAEYATGPVWTYSLGYNASYMLPTVILHIVIFFLISPFLKNYLKKINS